jgi:small multidrug resistance pump
MQERGMKWLLIVFGIAANASASVLVKVASRGPATDGSPLRLLLNPLLLAAIASYGLAFILYSVSLTKFPLNVAHPVATAGAVVAVGLTSYFGFRESMPAASLLGYGLLLAGIVFIAFGMHHG